MNPILIEALMKSLDDMHKFGLTIMPKSVLKKYVKQNRRNEKH